MGSHSLILFCFCLLPNTTSPSSDTRYSLPKFSPWALACQDKKRLSSELSSSCFGWSTVTDQSRPFLVGSLNLLGLRASTLPLRPDKTPRRMSPRNSVLSRPVRPFFGRAAPEHFPDRDAP